MQSEITLNALEEEVIIRDDTLQLNGILGIPENALGIIVFAHGSGSGRFSIRNNMVARHLQKAKFATLLMDLLTDEESLDRNNVFDINLLSSRLILAKNWLMNIRKIDMKIGYFGASTGAAAALTAAALEPEHIFAIVSRGGRPDLAKPVIKRVLAPTLLLVGGLDGIVIELNQEAFQQLDCIKEIKIIPGATHLFEEPGTLEQVAEYATDWFSRYMQG